MYFTIRKIFWLAIRPICYPELWRQLKIKIKNYFWPYEKNGRQSPDATSWCQSQAISTNQAIKLITNEKEFVPFIKKYPEEFQNALDKNQRCGPSLGGGANLDLLYYLSDYVKAKTVIETGLASGWSSLAILISIKKRGGMLFSTDVPYASNQSIAKTKKQLGHLVPDYLKNNWRVILYPDRVALPIAIKNIKTLDLAHYDSDKSYEGRLHSYKLLWQNLKKGGVLISDDISDNIAFYDFSKLINVKPLIVKDFYPPYYTREKYTGILIK